MKIPRFIKKASLLSIIMSVATIFLGVILVYSVCVQFAAGHWFSGCVSLLGVLLVIVAVVVVVLDLSHKSKE